VLHYVHVYCDTIVSQDIPYTYRIVKPRDTRAYYYCAIS